MTRLRRGPGAVEELEAVASVVQRLAVLLTAGVPPVPAWGYLVEPGATGRVLAEIVAGADSGLSIDDAIRQAVEPSSDGIVRGASEGWRGLAAAWAVASEAGAPLASTLHEFASAMRDTAQTGREVQVALAGPIATARMVMVLPLVGVLFGAALGFDTVGTLLGTPIGLGCLLAGSVLMLGARWWNRRLLASAAPASQTPGLVLDLVAIAVSGGASTSRAVGAVERACELAALPLEEHRQVIDEVFALSHRAGVPAAGLLRAEAVEARRRSRSEGARRAATLSVTLMLPLGLCILPAFMLVGVAPLMVAVISSTVAGF